MQTERRGRPRVQRSAAERTFDGMVTTVVVAALPFGAVAGLAWRLFRWAAGWGW